MRLYPASIASRNSCFLADPLVPIYLKIVRAIYLGMEGESSTAWPTIGDASSKCDMSREAVTSALVKARDRWSKQPGITEVRNDLAVLLNSNAGVLTAAEAAST